MRTSLLLLSLIVLNFSGWSQTMRLGTPLDEGIEISQDQPTILQNTNPVRMSKLRYLNGETDLPSTNAPVVNLIQRDRSDYIRCATTEMEAARHAADPTLPTKEDFEGWIARKIQEMDAAGHDRRATYEIPYIVHVVHSGESVGAGPNLAAAKVNAQMQQLNDDYQRNNSDMGNTPATFAAVTGSIDILFKPAEVDPFGATLAEPGIHRVNGLADYGISEWDGLVLGSNTQATLKPNTIWDPQRYMNIWTCNLGDNLLGYAQFPEAATLPGVGTGNGAASTDGIVVLYSSVGSLSSPGTAAPYQYGRTLTHEVGHWLGLRHIWGDGPMSGSCGFDDYCGDTPNAGAPNSTGAPCTFPGTNSCGSGGGDLADMFMNYMDYSDDECMNLFTDDQIDRILVVLADDGSGSPRRAELLTSTVGEGGGPTACQDWVNPSPGAPTGVWNDINDIFGGAPCDPGTGCPFNEVTAFEVLASEAYIVNDFIAGATYTFSMCNGAGGPGTGAMAWTPEFTILTPSGAIETFGAGDGDGCSITWTASESGNYTIVINEAGFCGSGSSNEAVNNGYPALTCVSGTEAMCLGPVANCNAGELANDDSLAVCPGETATLATDGTDTIPTGGQYRWNFSPGVDGTGANTVGFSIGGQTNPFTFNAGLNGILASVPVESGGPFPDMAGTWIVTGFILDEFDDLCSLTSTSRSINFLPDPTPSCDAVDPCSAGTLAGASTSICPEEIFTVATNGDEVIPEGGGYGWNFSPGVGATGGYIAGFNIDGASTSETWDNDLNGALSGEALDPLGGTWLISGFSYADSENVSSSICELTPTSFDVTFLDGGDPACAPATCEVPSGITVQSTTASSAEISWTEGSAESNDWDLELVDITDGGSPTGEPSLSLTSTAYNPTGLASANDYDVYVREICPDMAESDIIITGVVDGPLPGGLPKVVELYTLNAIADISEYGIGSANNGGGTDGIELAFPPMGLPGGLFVYFTTDSVAFHEFFGFPADVIDGFASINGDDAIELFKNGEVVDIFGDINVDGTGQSWEYLDGWASRDMGTGPDGSTFLFSSWSFSGPNALDGETTNSTAATPFPLGSYTARLSGNRLASEWVGPVRFTTLVDPCDPDLTDPTAVCQDFTVQLDASGNGTMTASNIDGGSTDACGEVTLSADTTSFNCMDLGNNTVILTVTDGSNNESTCTATVTVEDNVPPVAGCNDLTIQLDAGGSATLNPFDIGGAGSDDACAVEDASLSISGFDCGDLGPNTVLLIVFDGSGNSDSCTSTVTVEDPLSACVDPCDPDLTDPTAVCQDFTVQLDASGNGTMTASNIDGGSTDACGEVTLSADTTSFNCMDLGNNTVTLTVTDGSNNESTCTATVTVEDNVPPVAGCNDLTIQLDAGGSATLNPFDIGGAGSDDACAVEDASLSISSFDCGDLGPNTVLLIVFDGSGNSDSCTSTVTVEDPLLACSDPCDPDATDPTAVCQDFTVELDALGAGSITASDIDDGSSDACGGVSLSADITSFTCSELGQNTVTLTVTDGSTNENTCTSTVTVEDPLSSCVDPCDGVAGDSLNDPIMVLALPFTNIQNTDECFSDQYANFASDVWYQVVTGTTTDSLVMSTCADTSDFNTIIYLLNSSGDLISSNDDDLNCVFLGSRGGSVLSTLREDVDPSTTYYIVVDGIPGAGGTFELSIDEIELSGGSEPANDLCAGAIVVSCDDMVSGSTAEATLSDAPSFCGTSLASAPGVWYQFAGTGDAVTFSLCGSSFDTKMGVFSGSCGSLTCEDGNDDSDNCFDTESEVTVTTSPGTDYFIYVTGFDDETGDFDLTVTCETPPDVPANDSCTAAIDVFCDDVVSASTAGASADGSLIECGTDLTEGPGVWYHYTGTGDVTTFSLCGSSFDTKIGVFSGTCGSLVCENGNDDACGLQSETSLLTTPGADYYIYVTGFQTNAGDFTLEVTCAPAVPAPANDTCNGAIAIVVGDEGTCDGGPGYVMTSTAGATQTLLATCDGSGNDVDIWYTFTAISESVAFNSINGFPGIEIFEGSCGSLSTVGCINNASGTINGLTIGNDYIAMIWTDEPEDTVEFCLEVNPIGPCQAGVLIGADSIALCPDSLVTIVTDGDSIVPAGGSYGIFFEQGPDGTGALGEDFILFFQNTPYTFDQSLNGLLPDNLYPDFAGTWYVYGAVTADVNDPFNAICDLTEDYMVVNFLPPGSGSCAPAPPAPENDTCGGALAFTCPGGIPTTTVDATEATAVDAPFCDDAGSSVGAGLWYTYEGNGQLLDILAAPYGFDAEIQVWSGSCGALSCETTVDDGISIGDPELIEGFVTETGTTYYIYVGSWISSITEIDSFDLTITCSDPPMCPEPTALTISNIGETTADLSWTPGGDETIWHIEIVDLTAGDPVTGVPVFSGITDTFFTLVGGVPGNDYAVYVISDCGADSSEWAGPLEFTTLFPVPDNDLCAGAIEIGCDSVTAGTTLGAGNSDAPATCGTTLGSGPGVWYTFTGTGGDVTFSTCNAADFDTKIGVFSGVCGDLTCVDGNDDGTDCSGFSSEVTVATNAGETYYIYVTGFLSASGDFTLSVTCAEIPVCEAPTALTLGEVTDMTAEISWTAGDDETLWDLELVDVTGGGSFTGIPTENDLVSTSYLASGLTPGSTYEVWVRADCGTDTSAWVGPLEFTTVIPGPENDLCEGAIEVACGTTTFGSTITASASDAPDSFCGTSISAPGVWYYFAGNGDAVTFSTCDAATFDTKISVFTGSCGDLTCEDGNDDGPGCTGFTSELTVATTPGTNYYIYVHGFSSQTGDFDLTVTCVSPPDNDLCENAEDVTCGSVTAGTTSGATENDAPASCGTSVTAPGVWYHFAGTDQDVTFSTCNAATYDTKISVYSGSCGDLTCVDDNDDGPGCSGFSSELEVRTYVGTDYYVYIHGFSSQTGDFELSVTCADTCEAVTIEPGDISDVSCSGPGGVDITVTSGVGPFTFLWSDGSTDEDLVATVGGEYSVTVTGADGCVATAGPFEILEEPAPSETGPAAVTSPGCSFDGFGSIDVSIGGGTPPYEFLWSNGDTTEDLTMLSAGTYSLTVTDDVGCTYTTEDFVLTETNDLIEILPAVITPVDCWGNATGAIDISIGGGTPPYTYRWSNDTHEEDVEGLTAGQYVVYVEDATGCSYTSAIITVTEPDQLVVSGGAVEDAICNGESSGSITGISVTGGTMPYSYLWSDGTTTLDNTALAEGNHQLTVTDANGCVTLSAIYLIQAPAAISVTSIIVTDAACNGEATGAIDIEVSGGTPPYTYSWDNGETTQDITGLAAGDYSGTITDGNGCTFTGVITVGEPTAIEVTAVAVTDASCNGGDDGAIDISVGGGTPPYTYLWDNGETTQDIDGLTAGDYSGTITDANGCIFVGTITVGEPDPLAVTFLEITDISCNGGSDGSIDIEVGGGTPPYTYLWSNGETTQDLEDLGLGVYTGTITDANGCTLVSPGLPIAQPAPLSLIIVSVDDNLCNGDADGEIEILVAGGTEPYTYLWSNGSTNESIADLQAGLYSVTVTDANDCVIESGDIEVEEPFVVFEALPAVVTDVSCNGDTDGSIDITLEGGTLAYDVVWSNGANTEDPTDLAPGEYTFTVTDFNGCFFEFPSVITVGEPDILLPVSLDITDVACTGESTGAIDVTMGGGTPPYTYVWSDGSTDEDLTGVPAGAYNGVVTDANGCTFTSPVPIPIAEPEVALEATGESTPASDPGTTDGSVTVTVTGGDGPYDFLWNTGDVTQNLENVGVGTFCADITDANGCTIELCVEVGLNTAVLDIFQISDLTLYPNPSTDVANLNMSFTTAVDVDIQLTDVLGRVLEATESLNVVEQEVTFDVRDYSAGTYFIRIRIEGQVITLPLVVQH